MAQNGLCLPMADADDTAPKQRGVPFKPGVSGNPAGRPRGARSRLATDLLEALADDFSEHGAASVVKMRQTDNTAYIKTIAALLPREIVVAALHVSTKTTLDEMVEARDFSSAYKLARDMIGIAPPVIDIQADAEHDLRDSEIDY
jgi:Family of unknown function (DUF5681)